MVLIDTPIWSHFFRRASPDQQVSGVLRLLIEQGEAALLGPVRQEILSGIRDTAQLDKLKTALRAFPDAPLSTADYEEAALMFNHCRSHGVQGSQTDFLICASAVRHGASIYTLDRDFETYATWLPVRLYQP